MRSPADALKDPQPGDVVELRPGFTRTVTRRVDDWLVFESLYNGGRKKFTGCSVASWQCACDLLTARVIRRGEDV